MLPPSLYVCSLWCFLFVPLTMSDHCNFPPGYSVSERKVLLNRACSVEVGSQHTKVYDLTKYEFVYTAEESSVILKILNQCSEEELHGYKVTKGLAKKLIKGRSRIGIFQDVSQLLDIDGFGLKNVENICGKLLCEPSKDRYEEELDFKAVLHKKRLVKPRLCPKVKEELQTILAVDVMIGSLSWTLLDNHGAVLDMGVEELVSRSARLDAPKLYNKMVSITRNLPKADAYVWEERANYGYLQKAPLGSIIVAIKLAQIKGILTALLDSRQKEDEERLFYLKDALVSKLFNLKVGDERISGFSIAEEIMSCKKVLDWLPPQALDEEIKDKYFSLDKNERKFLSTSLFIGLAFQQAVVANNLRAHKIIADNSS